MADYRKKYAIRYALWRAYDMKCFYCRKPVAFVDLTIDHVLPRSLLGDPNSYEAVLRDYEIMKTFPEFSIDDVPNLVPACGPDCNFRKGAALLPKQATLCHLSRVRSKLPKVINELELLAKTARRGTVLGRLGAALERSEVSPRDVLRLVRTWDFWRTRDEPLVVCFGLNFAETVAMRGIVIREPAGYAHACDDLEAELSDFLRARTRHSFHYAETSQRTGETLSVRLVFPELDVDAADELPLRLVEDQMPWWELLEIGNWYQIYGERYEETYGQGP